MRQNNSGECLGDALMNDLFYLFLFPCVLKKYLAKNKSSWSQEHRSVLTTEILLWPDVEGNLLQISINHIHTHCAGLGWKRSQSPYP